MGLEILLFDFTPLLENRLIGKYYGAENSDFQIHASFGGTQQYIISGSETPSVFIWDAKRDDTGKKSKRNYEYFMPFGSAAKMVTVAIFGPNLEGFTGEVIVTAGLDGRIKIFHNQLL